MADKVTYPFIRGDTFSIPMTLTDPDSNDSPVNLTGWTISSQVRYSKRLVSTLNVTITDAAEGNFTISLPKEETVNWPAREILCDIQFDRPEGRVSSKTFIIKVSGDQTQ